MPHFVLFINKLIEIMKKKFSIIFVSCLMMVSFSLSAQLGEDDGGEPPPTEPLPINDYIPLLILAGITFGSFVIYKRIKKSGENL